MERVTNKAIKLSRPQKDFIENQNNCTLCGGQLEIHVETYLQDYTLREEATCDKCEVVARVKDHRMN